LTRDKILDEWADIGGLISIALKTVIAMSPTTRPIVPASVANKPTQQHIMYTYKRIFEMLDITMIST
jgi:hypothetical protein